MKPYIFSLLLVFSLYSCLQSDKNYTSPNVNKNQGNESTKENLLTLAKEQYNNKNYDKAITFYSSVIEKDNESIDAYYGRGNSYTAKGSSSNALKDYKKAKELSLNQNKYLIDKIKSAISKALSIPSSKISLTSYGTMKDFGACGSVQSDGTKMKSEKDLPKENGYIHSSNIEARKLVFKAIVACRNYNDLQTSLKYIDEAIGLDSQYAYAYYAKGNILRDLIAYRNVDKSNLNVRISAYKKAIDLSDKVLYDAFSSLLEIYMTLGKYQLVVDNYEKFINSMEKDPSKTTKEIKFAKTIFELFYVNRAKKALKG